MNKDLVIAIGAKMPKAPIESDVGSIRDKLQSIGVVLLNVPKVLQGEEQKLFLCGEIASQIVPPPGWITENINKGLTPAQIAELNLGTHHTMKTQPGTGMTFHIEESTGVNVTDWIKRQMGIPLGRRKGEPSVDLGTMEHGLNWEWVKWARDYYEIGLMAAKKIGLEHLEEKRKNDSE